MSSLMAPVTGEQIPCVCMRCRRTYKYLPGVPPFPGAYSSGYCPDCLSAMELEWHGKKVSA